MILEAIKDKLKETRGKEYSDKVTKHLLDILSKQPSRKVKIFE